jgi:hypothetical protein
VSEVRPPTPKGRWAYVTTDLRVLLTCAQCGCVVQGSHRAQHEKWHEYLRQLAAEVTQPALFNDPNDEPPPF